MLKTMFTKLLFIYGITAPMFSGELALAESSTAFGKMGPYRVSMSEVSDQGILLVPSVNDGNEDQAAKQWPGIVFCHGLCGSAKMYSKSLERLCSWGFVIIANQDQEDCGVVNLRRPMQSLNAVNKFQYCVNSSVMAANIERNLHYLASRGDVNPDKLALVGHSMGGGVSIDVATSINEQQPGYVKAVIGIAPWNGAQPTPSSVVNKLNVPLLIFCSMADKICPCSGRATAVDIAVDSSPFPRLASRFEGRGMAYLFGSGADPYWHGGSEAIYKNARSATLVEVLKTNHFAIAGTDGKQMEHLAHQMASVQGFGVNLEKKPYNWVPTLEYSVAFLYDSLGINPEEGKSVMSKIDSDDRVARVYRK